VTQKTRSINKQSRWILILTLFFLGFVVAVLSLVLGFVQTHNAIAEDSRGILRQVNSLALAARQGDSASSDVQDVYAELCRLHNASTSQIKEVPLLLPPVYTSGTGQLYYQEQIREYAYRVSTVLTDYQSLILGRITKFSLAGVVMALAVAVMVILWRYAFTRFLSAVMRGARGIHRILNFEQIDSKDLTVEKISELQDFSLIIQRVSADLQLERALQDMEVHGNLNELMESVYLQMKDIMPCDRVAVAFLDNQGHAIAEAAHTTYPQAHLEPGFSESIGGTGLETVLYSGQPRIINDLPAYGAAKTPSQSTRHILEEGIQSSLTLPLFFKQRCVGFFFVSSRDKHSYTEEHKLFANRIINVLKQRIYLEFLLQQVISETANAFVLLMGERDSETGLHILRMSKYSYFIAQEYYNLYGGIGPRFIREMLWFAPLHDIGKIGVSDAILRKPGPLDSEETKVMQQHVTIGERVIQGMNKSLGDLLQEPLMTTAVELIGDHHEKFNGGGYPRGKKGEEISLAGRIVAMADVFDALTTTRPYKEAYSIEKTLDIMENKMEGHFDPRVMTCFKTALPRCLEIYEKYRE